MKRLDRARARVAASDPRWLDGAIAVLFAAGTLVEIALADAHGESRALTAVLGLALCVPIAFRRQAPEAAIVAFSVALVVQGVAGDNFLLDDTNAPFVAILFMLYSLGRHAERLWPAGAVYLGALVVAIALSDDGFTPSDAAWFIFMFGLPVLAGRALRSRALLQRELHEKALGDEADQRRRAVRATEAERNRIAEELQAVVANGVSAMVVQAEAVPRVLERGESARAAESLAVIEETGRDALVEMRRLLGVLRRDGEGPALQPQPGLARLTALVERRRERGLGVELKVEGAVRPLAPGVDLTAYRVLEDALDAAAGQASVLVRHREVDLQLEVRSDRGEGPADRLPGLRDRVGLYGGHLSVDHGERGGFRLRARLPVEEAAR